MGGILRRVKRAEAKKRESKAAGEEKKGQKYIQGDVKESVLKEEWRKKKADQCSISPPTENTQSRAADTDVWLVVK